jgi:hypothetical protein
MHGTDGTDVLDPGIPWDWSAHRDIAPPRGVGTYLTN